MQTILCINIYDITIKIMTRYELSHFNAEIFTLIAVVFINIKCYIILDNKECTHRHNTFWHWPK